jgi:large subunit ribosomal protein L29
MKYADMSGLSANDLRKKKKELQESLFEARMKNSLGQLTNPMTIRQMRRDVARLTMALNMKNKKEARG